MEEKDEVIEARKEKVKEIFISKQLWVILALIAILILGVYIRSQPMKIRPDTGKPGLWDITKEDYALGPDLDPYLFLRYAKTIIEQGSLPKIDAMRNVPLGFDTSTELQMTSYMIVLTYKIVNLFGSYSVNFAGVLMPVIFFALTIIAFFLFVREVFIRKDSAETKKANIIALISTLFMVVVPVFLSRTVAGIPEKESVAFLFMFLSFYLFLKALKASSFRGAIILGGFAGITTALMGLTWGGVTYVYATVAITGFIAFILNKFKRKEAFVLASWLVIATIITLLFTKRTSLVGSLTSLDTGLVYFTLFSAFIHFVLWKTKLNEMRFLRESKLPRNIISLIVAFVLALVLAVIFFGPGIIFEKINAINNMMFRPIVGRWVTTVAENKQPFFSEWKGSFGPFIRGIPVLFWLFFIGSIVLFRKMLQSVRKKDAWILTGIYILFFIGLVFSRYSPSSMFNGENFPSKLFYYGSALLLIGSFIYYHVKYHKENEKGFEGIELKFLFLFSLFFVCLFTARSAVRLIMVLGPIAPIFLSSLAVESVTRFRKENNETIKVVIGIAVLILIVLSLFIFFRFYKEVKVQAYYHAPYDYTQQWQKAMAWVRNNTPEDAVFAHWWDYGYWLQSIGERATVTDGGNAIVWWNYLTGRYVLTGDNERDALELLYNHNTSYLLIDSTDLGKYGAFSQIGSDKNLDRISQGPVTFLADNRAIKETKTGIIREYNIPAGEGRVMLSPIEEDIVFEKNGSKIILLKEKTGLMGIKIFFSQINDSILFEKAEAVFVSSDRQTTTLPLQYVYYNGSFIDFKEGIKATAYIIQRVSPSSLDNMGAVMYISPRLMRGFLSQVYILNDPLKNFPHFKLAYVEQGPNIARIRQQGYSLNEFSYLDGKGVEGPIKIWSIEYTGNEKINEEWLRTTPPEWVDWKF